MPTDIITSYRAYLSGKRYAAGTIDSALRMARRLLNLFSEADLLSTDTIDVIEVLGVKPKSSTSKHWYKYHINMFKSFLKRGA